MLVLAKKGFNYEDLQTPPMKKGMQNHNLVLYIRQPWSIVMIRKRMVNVMAPGRLGRYSQR
jgi:hypothetical protein